MRVLVTRPEPDATRFAAELAGLGFKPILAPLLAYTALPFDPKEVLEARALIFTSGNALRALADAGTKPPSTTPVYCVGEGTARKARAAGYSNIVTIADTAAALSVRMADASDRDFVHVAGRHKAFNLQGSLQEKGLSIRTLSVYSMEAVAELNEQVCGDLAHGTIDGVTLLSPRTARVYASLVAAAGLVNAARQPTYYCLSTAVAERVRPLDCGHVRIAPRPRRRDLVDLLVQDAKQEATP